MERKKNRYTYYHCTGYRGKCVLPYMREEVLGNRLGQVLKDIHIPDDVLAKLEHSLLHERAYTDKLDGKITEEFWETRFAAWNREEQQVLFALRELEHQSPNRILDGVRILELANKACFLYLKQSPAEQGKLLRILLSNCKVDATSVYPTYRKPFDVIFQHAKNEGWCPREDSNLHSLARTSS
jgi:site-specific DNA recombinase